MRAISEHNTAWRNWFAANGVQPYVVTYEEIVADMAGVTRAILEYLALDTADLDISPGHERQGDDINADWIRRYRAPTGADIQE